MTSISIYIYTYTHVYIDSRLSIKIENERSYKHELNTRQSTEHLALTIVSIQTSNTIITLSSHQPQTNLK